MKLGDSLSADEAMVELAFEPVIHDLVASGYTAELGNLTGRASDGQLLTELTVNAQTLGPLTVDPGASDAERVRNAAYFVQDRLLESRTDNGSAVVWPVCRPGHGHPQELTPPGPGWPAWTCPREPGWDVSVGHLSEN